MDSLHLLIISGGNRAASFTTKFAHALPGLLPEGVTAEVIDSLGAFPLFNQDLENEYPEAVASFKENVRGADGIIIATPEHNRSIPAVLKNAIDWISRPYGTNAWAKKPALFMGVTPGGFGAAQALTHLRNIGLFTDMRIMGQPEVYMSNIKERLADDGTIADESTRAMLKTALASFAEFVRKER